MQICGKNRWKIGGKKIGGKKIGGKCRFVSTSIEEKNDRTRIMRKLKFHSSFNSSVVNQFVTHFSILISTNLLHFSDIL